MRNFTISFNDQLDKLVFLLVLKIAANVSVMWIYPVGKAQAWKEVTEPCGGWVIAVVGDGAGCMGSAAHS